MESIFFHPPPSFCSPRLWSFVTPIQSALVFSVTPGSKNGRRKSTRRSVGTTDGRRLIRQDRSKVLKWEGILKSTKEEQAGKKGSHFQRPRSEISDVAISPPLEIGAATGSSSTKKRRTILRKLPFFKPSPPYPTREAGVFFGERLCIGGVGQSWEGR